MAIPCPYPRAGEVAGESVGRSPHWTFPALGRRCGDEGLATDQRHHRAEEREVWPLGHGSWGRWPWRFGNPETHPNAGLGLGRGRSGWLPGAHGPSPENWAGPLPWPRIEGRGPSELWTTGPGRWALVGWGRNRASCVCTVSTGCGDGHWQKTESASPDRWQGLAPVRYRCPHRCRGPIAPLRQGIQVEREG